jgi:hypothetical protein
MINAKTGLAVHTPGGRGQKNNPKNAKRPTKSALFLYAAGPFAKNGLAVHTPGGWGQKKVRFFVFFLTFFKILITLFQPIMFQNILSKNKMQTLWLSLFILNHPLIYAVGVFRQPG